MPKKLVVTKPFLKYVRGDMISDPNSIKEIIRTAYKKCTTPVGFTDPLKD